MKYQKIIFIGKKNAHNTKNNILQMKTLIKYSKLWMNTTFKIIKNVSRETKVK